MKFAVVSVIAGMLGLTGTSSTANNIHYGGVWCKTWGKPKAILCIKEDGTGYGIGISKDLVLVQNSRGKRVFVRIQP